MADAPKNCLLPDFLNGAWIYPYLKTERLTASEFWEFRTKLAVSIHWLALPPGVSTGAQEPRAQGGGELTEKPQMPTSFYS